MTNSPIQAYKSASVKQETTTIVVEPTPTHNSLSKESKITTPTKIDDSYYLFHALEKIGNWWNLCKNLRVDQGIMERLKFSKDDEVIKMTNCLDAYVNSDEASWEDVAIAVVRPPIKNKKVARDIANKYLSETVNYETIMKKIESL